MKSTLVKGVKQYLKLIAYKRSKPPCGVTAYLLHNEPTSYSSLARLKISDLEPERKRVLTGRSVSGGRRET